jgi:transmembrane sensor
LVKAGEFDAAWAEIEKLGTEGLGKSAGELMDAADAARLSGHPKKAVPILERVLADHPKSPEAPLAAYTLGKLQAKRQPARAARAFAKARKLAPKGPLAEDALAHEVEALRAAGRESEAEARAAEYRAQYPGGRWASSMRQQ